MRNTTNRCRSLAARLGASLVLALGPVALAPAPAVAAPTFLTRAAAEDVTWAEGLASQVRSEVAHGRFADALPLCLKALELREKRLGKNAEEVAESLSDLGIIQTGLQDFAAAERSLNRSLAIREKSLGKDHPYVGRVLGHLAILWVKRGELPRAEPLYVRALAIAEKERGPMHQSVGTALHNLGLLYVRMGDYARAEPILLRALNVRQTLHMPDSIAVGMSHSALGGVYRGLGDYPKARAHFEKAVEIMDMAQGFEPPELGSALNNLAEIRSRMGDYDEALPLFERAVAVRERLLGPDHAQTAFVLDNLAAHYISRGEIERAEPIVRRALAIKQKSLGEEHLELGTTLHHLAEILQSKGDLDGAMAAEARALAIKQKSLGEEHAYVSMSLMTMAAIHREKGELDQASALLRRAQAIRERAAGPTNPDLASALDAMARIELDAGRPGAAMDLLKRSIAINDRHAGVVLTTGSEHQKKAFMSTMQAQTDLAVALHALFEPGRAEAAELALSTILARKGRVLDAMADSMLALRAAPKEEDQELLSSLIKVQRRRSEMAIRGPLSMTLEEYVAKLAALEREQGELEAKASEISQRTRADSRPLAVADVRAVIPEGAALLEIARYSPEAAQISRSKGAPEPDRYAAYVLRKSGPIGFADLGDATRLDALVAKARPALADPRRDPKPLARELGKAILGPLGPILGDTRWILLSPDGSLNLIPFGALLTERGRYEIEDRSFTYITSGRDLLRIAAPRRSALSGPLVLGNPLFGARGRRSVTNAGAPPQGKAASGSSSALRGVDMGKLAFPQLAGTAVEVEAIRVALKDATLLVGKDATEAALKAAHGPWIVHLATHGFFLGDPAGPAPARARGLLLEDGWDPSAIQGQNPLLRSGLALAGANVRAGGAEDGLLTALEAAGLDLTGTKLVVLSACETGVGEARVGEGVYGLRRALVLAGSETQVMSLWRVSDTATRDLMVAYYKGLASGGGRSEALRQVEREMLATPERSHPYYWASFIVSGDGSSLEGELRPPINTPVAPPKVAPSARGCACEAAGAPSPPPRGSVDFTLVAGAAGVMAACSRRRRRGGGAERP